MEANWDGLGVVWVDCQLGEWLTLTDAVHAGGKNGASNGRADAEA